jgi:hypothetical protein
MAREQGISKSLSSGRRRRTRGSSSPGCGCALSGPRTIAAAALARKLLVALWRYLETGLVPEGAVLKG